MDSVELPEVDLQRLRALHSNDIEYDKAVQCARNRRFMESLALGQAIANVRQKINERVGGTTVVRKKRAIPNSEPKPFVERTRASARVANKPAPNYKGCEARWVEVEVDETRKKRKRGRGSQGDREGLVSSTRSVSGQGWQPSMELASRQAAKRSDQAAKDLVEELVNNGKVAVCKPMSSSQVCGGFWNQMPYGFHTHFRDAKYDLTLHYAGPLNKTIHAKEVLPAEVGGGTWNAVFLPKGGGAGLSGGWRGFAMDNMLFPNDSVVYEKMDMDNIRMHIFRAHDYERKSDAADAEDGEARADDEARSDTAEGSSDDEDEQESGDQAGQESDKEEGESDEDKEAGSDSHESSSGRVLTHTNSGGKVVTHAKHGQRGAVAAKTAAELAAPSADVTGRRRKTAVSKGDKPAGQAAAALAGREAARQAGGKAVGQADGKAAGREAAGPNGLKSSGRTTQQAAPPTLTAVAASAGRSSGRHAVKGTRKRPADDVVTDAAPAASRHQTRPARATAAGRSAAAASAIAEHTAAAAGPSKRTQRAGERGTATTTAPVAEDIASGRPHGDSDAEAVESGDAGDEEGEEFFVRYILDWGLAEDNSHLFKVRWWNYGPEADSWEPADCLNEEPLSYDWTKAGNRKTYMADLAKRAGRA